MSADALGELRRRLFARIAWFRDRSADVVLAQLARADDPGWAARVDDDAHRICDAPAAWLAAAGAPGPDLVEDPAALLRELETLDLAAMLVGGRAGPRPSVIVGAGTPHAGELIVRTHRRRPSSAGQPGSIASNLRYHAFIPAQVRAKDLAFGVRVLAMRRELGREAARRGSVRIATTSFGDDAILGGPGDGRFRFLATPAGEAGAVAVTRRARLEAAIRAAVEAEVDIFVAPELTLPPAERDALLRTLRDAPGPSILVPGSFHEEDAGDAGRRANVHRAVLTDRFGIRRLEHRKLRPYGTFGKGLVERFHPGREITVILTPVGLIAVAICKDFCDDLMQAIWDQVQPDWLLVPAYGPGASAHEQAARHVGRTVGTITILAHEPLHSVRCAPDAADGGARCFVHDEGLRSLDVRYAPAFALHQVEITDHFDELARRGPVN